jgi:hypothetical protein
MRFREQAFGWNEIGERVGYLVRADVYNVSTLLVMGTEVT